MHARITTVAGASDLDRSLALLRDQVVPHLQQQKGFRGLSAAGDRAAHVVTMLSLWDSQADLEASESAAPSFLSPISRPARTPCGRAARVSDDSPSAGGRDG